MERIRAVLDNPLYAGAYVYGRSKRHTIVYSDQHIERLDEILQAKEEELLEV